MHIIGSARKEYGYWQNKANQKKFFDELAIKLGISNTAAFAKLTKGDYIKHGGSSLLAVYGCSIKRTLKSVFSGNLEISNLTFRNSVARRMVL